MSENIEHIICLYLSGESNSEEEKVLYEWINLSKENEQLFFEQMALWRMKSELKDSNVATLNYSLSKLNARIKKQEKKRKYSLNQRIIWSSIAAAVFIGAIFITSLFSTDRFSPPLITYSNTMEDSIMTITLDDQTIVWLNTNSSLSVSADFLENERKVNLSGCAFFEVAKDSLQPFIVSSDQFQIRVLGTSFGISTDYAENLSEAILLEGSVQLENRHGDKLASLFPGQQALISKNSNTIEINNVDARKVDPRAPSMFVPAIDGGDWRGVPPGLSRTEANAGIYKRVNLPELGILVKGGAAYKSRPYDVFLYEEVCFLKAEAALRGFVAGDAKAEYEKGVNASFSTWGVSSQAGEYLASTAKNEAGTSANFDDISGAGNTALEKIITQKYLALFPDMSMEAWNDKRRLNLPRMDVAAFRHELFYDNNNKDIKNPTNFIRRVQYPQNEKTINKDEYSKGVALLGGEDNVTTSIWWDKKANYCTSAK